MHIEIDIPDAFVPRFVDVLQATASGHASGGEAERTAIAEAARSAEDAFDNGEDVIVIDVPNALAAGLAKALRLGNERIDGNVDTGTDAVEELAVAIEAAAASGQDHLEYAY